MNKYKTWGMEAPWDNEDASLRDVSQAAGATQMDRLFSDLGELIAHQKVLISAGHPGTPPPRTVSTPSSKQRANNTSNNSFAHPSTSAAPVPTKLTEHRLSADGSCVLPAQSGTPPALDAVPEPLVFSIRTVRRLQQRLDQQEETNKRLKRQLEEQEEARKQQDDNLRALMKQMEEVVTATREQQQQQQQQHQQQQQQQKQKAPTTQKTDSPVDKVGDDNTTTTITSPTSASSGVFEPLPVNVQKAVDDCGRKERAYVEGLRDQFEEFISWHQIEIDALKDEILKGNYPFRRKDRKESASSLEGKVESPTSAPGSKFGSPRPNKKKKHQQQQRRDDIDDDEHTRRVRRYSVMTEQTKEEKASPEEEKVHHDNLLRQHRKSIAFHASVGNEPELKKNSCATTDNQISEELLYGVTLSRRHSMTASAYVAGLDRESRASLESFSLGEAEEPSPSPDKEKASALAAVVVGTDDMHIHAHVPEHIESDEGVDVDETDVRDDDDHDHDDEDDPELGEKKDSFASSVAGFSFGTSGANEESGSEEEEPEIFDPSGGSPRGAFKFGVAHGNKDVEDDSDDASSDSDESDDDSDDSDDSDDDDDSDEDDESDEDVMDEAEYEARMRSFSLMSGGAPADADADKKDGLEMTSENKVREHRKSIAQFAGGIDPQLLYGVTLSRRHSMSTSAYNAGYDSTTATDFQSQKFAFGDETNKDNDDDEEEEEEKKDSPKPVASHRKSVAFGAVHEKEYSPKAKLSTFTFGGSEDNDSGDDDDGSEYTDESGSDVMDDDAYQEQLRRFSGISAGGMDPAASTLEPDSQARVREHRKSIAQFAGGGAGGGGVDPNLLFGVTLSRRHSMSTAAYNSNFDSQFGDDMQRRFSFGEKSDTSSTGDKKKKKKKGKNKKDKKEKDEEGALGGFSFGGGGGNDGSDEDDSESSSAHDDEEDVMDDNEHEARMRRFSGMSTGITDNSAADEKDGLEVSAENRIREHRKSIAQFAGGGVGGIGGGAGGGGVDPNLLFGVTLSRRHSMSTAAYNSNFDSQFGDDMQRRFSFGEKSDTSSTGDKKKKKKKKGKKEKKKKDKKNTNGDGDSLGGFSFGSAPGSDDDDATDPDDDDENSDDISSDGESRIGQDEEYNKLDTVGKARIHRKSIAAVSGVNISDELLHGVTLSRRHSMSHLMYKAGQEDHYFEDDVRRYSFGEQDDEEDNQNKKSKKSKKSKEKAQKKKKSEKSKTSKKGTTMDDKQVRNLTKRVDTQEKQLEKQQDMIDKLTTELEKAVKMVHDVSKNPSSGTKRPVHKRKPTATPGAIALAKEVLAQQQQQQGPTTTTRAVTLPSGADAGGSGGGGSELFVGQQGEVTLSIPSLNWEVADASDDQQQQQQNSAAAEENQAEYDPSAPKDGEKDLRSFSFGS